MEHLGTVTLETKRLQLRMLTMEDAQAVFTNWASDPMVSRYVTWPTHRSLEDTRAYLGYCVESYGPDRYNWGIVLKESGQLIGMIDAVGFSEKLLKAEIGYCMSRVHWGKGIMAEALCCVRDFLFDEVGLERIEARHDTRNPASGRVMEKAGMLKEGLSRHALRDSSGEFIDLVLYGMLRSDPRT